MTEDAFGTRALRERVLRAWGESPARFREDANAEEDYALGGYRDRVVIELAQNAADAALRGGVPGRLRLSLRTTGDPSGAVLTAANTGVPLDPAGVEALSTLRASAKRDDTGAVGRFGVGFAAVVAVSDRPAIATARPEPSSRGGTPPHTPRSANEASPIGAVGGVEWSADRARELASGVPALAGELERRAGHVPLLRLPFALPAADLPPIPSGFTTVVRLPLRDQAAGSVRRQLDQAGPALLLALPALETVEIDIDGAVRTLTAEHPVPTGEASVARRGVVPPRKGDMTGTVVIDGAVWVTAEAQGVVPAELLADRPVEERARPYWQVRWAMPEDGDGKGLPDGTPAVVHAPTPSDERLDLPALLIATFPLASDRRHVAPGPLTDFIVERAAETYERLLSERPPTPRLLGLVPGPVGAGELDARLRRAILRRLPDAPLLPAPAEDHRMRGRDAIAVDAPAAFVGLLAGDDAGPSGILPPAWPARHAALAALGVRRVELADLIDELAAADREPAWWHRVYESLAGAATDALGALPVPLAGVRGWDGGVRVVRGPRGLLIAADGVDPAGLDALGLRFVHPEAVHPLLLRLGAVEAGPRAVLADPAVRAAAEGSFEADDPEEIVAAVLGLVAAARIDPGEEPWLADLALPGESAVRRSLSGASGGEGGRPPSEDTRELYAAGELLLPDSPLRELVVADAPFGVVAQETLERWGPETLKAVGVLDGFALVRGEDVNLTGLADEAETFHLDDEDRWAEDVLDRLGPQDLPPLLPEFQAVRDLDLVEDWRAALRLLAGPEWRAAIVDPAHVMLHDGRRVAIPSYTAWWLSRNPVLEGRRPGEFRLPGDAPDMLAGLYDVAPEGLDERLLLAMGVRTSLFDLLDAPGGAQELLDRLGDPDRTVTRAQLGELWTALADAPEVTVEPPDQIRAVVDGEVEVVDAADALVLDRPDVLPLLPGQPLVIAVQGRDARLAELLDLPLASEEVPGVVESAGEKLPVPLEVRALLPDASATYLAHDPLVVGGRNVPWWTGDDQLHVDRAQGPHGLARALAWTTGRWADRLLIEAVLRDPEALPLILAEADLES